MSAPVRGCIELDLSREVDHLGRLDHILFPESLDRPGADGMAVRVHLGDARRVSTEAAARIASATWGAAWTDVVGRHRQAVEDVIAVIRDHRARAEAPL